MIWDILCLNLKSSMQKDFGVPQNRERIFIVGFHSNTGVNEFDYPEPLNQSVNFCRCKRGECCSNEILFVYTIFTYIKTPQKERHKNKGNGFGYEIISDDQIANAVVCGGMGRERNLVYDDRINRFYAYNQNQRRSQSRRNKENDTTRMEQDCKVSRIISLFPSQMFTRINNLAILLPYLQFKQLQMKF